MSGALWISATSHDSISVCTNAAKTAKTVTPAGHSHAPTRATNIGITKFQGSAASNTAMNRFHARDEMGLVRRKSSITTASVPHIIFIMKSGKASIATSRMAKAAGEKSASRSANKSRLTKSMDTIISSIIPTR